MQTGCWCGLRSRLKDARAVGGFSLSLLVRARSIRLDMVEGAGGAAVKNNVEGASAGAI